jgi:hypothetical protein
MDGNDGGRTAAPRHPYYENGIDAGPAWERGRLEIAFETLRKGSFSIT